MLAIVFRYVKTLVAFLVITAIIITGIVLSVIFSTNKLSLAVRLIGIIIAYILFSLVIFIFAIRLFKEEIDNKENKEADLLYVIKLLNSLIGRIKIKSIKRMLLLERATAKIYMLDFKSAEIDISDAMVAGLKGDMLNYAFFLYAQLTFFNPDLDRFFKYAASGREYLLNLTTLKNVKPEFISVVVNELNILNALEAFLKADASGALKILDGIMVNAATNNLTSLTSRLIAIIMQMRSNIQPSAEYAEYIRVNAKDTIFEQNLNKILSAEIN